MDSDLMAAGDGAIVLRLALALAIGGIVGLEREYHSRPAGFRTHALVCLASALLLLPVDWIGQWATGPDAAQISLDPTRIVQGLMTGIGFLGAGTIVKSGSSVRGLTTAASIWATAAIGIMLGAGFIYPALLAAALLFATLTVFRWVEERVPVKSYVRVTLEFDIDDPPGEAAVRGLMHESGFSILRLTREFGRDERRDAYRVIAQSRHARNEAKLAEQLHRMPEVRRMRIAPWGGG